MQYFIDSLAAPRFEKTAFKHHPKGFGFGVFLDIFGDGFPITKKMLGSPNVPFVRCQGVWTDSHKYGKKEFDLAIKLGVKLNQIATQHGKPVYYSPWCEHDESASDILELLNKLKPLCPNLKLINTPNKGGPLVAGFLNETHGDYIPSNKKIDFYSADGQSSVDTNIEKRKQQLKNVDAFGFWDANLNLKKEDKDSTPRPKRKVRPQPHIFKALAYLANEKGNTKLPQRWIWKTHAEQHNVPESSREHKPVLICPVEGPEAKLVTMNGKKVATLPRRGNFQDGRAMYRTEDFYGFELSEIAKKKSGSDLVMVVINKKELAIINPAFRDGAYIYD